nr:tRNA uridine-5-carboxymethylaminomethyl(34) synthesis GTPase MnmE [Paludibacter sp.]
MNNSTICAISTPPGIGGIAVIRVSGADAFAICDSIFLPARKDISISLAESHKLLYGEIRDNENL